MGSGVNGHVKYFTADAGGSAEEMTTWWVLMKGTVTALWGLIPTNSFNPHNSPMRWEVLCQPLQLTIAPHGPSWVWASEAGGCGQLEGSTEHASTGSTSQLSLLGSIILGKSCNISAFIPYTHTGNNGTCPRGLLQGQNGIIKPSLAVANQCRHMEVLSAE